MNQVVTGISACLIHSTCFAVGLVAGNLLNFVSSGCTEFNRKGTRGVPGVDTLNFVCSRYTVIISVAAKKWNLRAPTSTGDKIRCGEEEHRSFPGARTPTPPRTVQALEHLRRHERYFPYFFPEQIRELHSREGLIPASTDMPGLAHTHSLAHSPRPARAGSRPRPALDAVAAPSLRA